MSFEIDPSYVDVAERISTFRDKHPEGSLQQVSVGFQEFAGTAWVIYTAAAYRTPEDARPGHGTAWEPVPGRTPYTKGSELQNAETAAWGRAIVAVLAADTKRGVASAQEVRNRKAEREEPSLKSQVWEASRRVDFKLQDDERRAWILGELEALGGDTPENLSKLLKEWVA